MRLGNGEFWLGDCLELMARIPDGSVDMVVTSPPYDNLRTYNGSNDWSFDIFQRVAAELKRILKQGGTIVWIVGDATIDCDETGSSFRQALHFKDVCGLKLNDTMIWNKGSFTAVGALKQRYAQTFEYMFVLTKGKAATFNPIKDRLNKVKGKISGNLRLADGSMKRMSTDGKERAEYGQRFAIWDIPPMSGNNTGHPAPFPINLAQDHILSWSNPGDLVLDPFGGSGTTAIAAEQTGRRWLCIERDPAYYYGAVGRVAALV